ncbi:hypothetical protein VPHK436_0021 [Vibrio phage K436]
MASMKVNQKYTAGNGWFTTVERGCVGMVVVSKTKLTPRQVRRAKKFVKVGDFGATFTG